MYFCLCYSPISKCYHSLVMLIMGAESSSDMASKEQGWNVLTEVLEVLDSRPKVLICACIWFMYTSNLD